MPLFHFNLRGGPFGQDNEGTELPDVEAARIEAVRLLGEVLADQAPRVAPDQDWQLEVTDEVGLLIYCLTFSLIASPAVKQPMSRTN